MDKILPCPWCNGHSVISGILTPAYVECNECEAIGPEKPTHKEAIEVWNRMSNRRKNVMIKRKWDIQFSWNPWFSLGLHFDHTDPSIVIHLPLLIIYAGRCKQPGFR